MTLKTFSCAFLVGCSFILLAPSTHQKGNKYSPIGEITICNEPKGCVFRTLFGEEPSGFVFKFETPQNVGNSIEKGLQWMLGAQLSSGGWGSGSHHRQLVMDPLAVNADPATTAMVGMAFLRTGTTFTSGENSRQLREALYYLIESVETTPSYRMQITAETGTQIQTKLGQNIDAVLALQFFSNAMDYLQHDPHLKERVMSCMNICSEKIQKVQDIDGSFKGSGWAGVLQSALANSALESAQNQGADIDDEVLQKSRDYQKGNYDAKTGRVKTDRGAGVVLYSVSGSARATAKEARKVKEAMNIAKREGRLKGDAKVSAENLMEIGFTQEEALEYVTSYEIYESSKTAAQDDRVMDGFGSNGGEEFLSYLQTGESLMINRDQGWKTWYYNVSGRLISIQNLDGSWNGHHCITSPVFCTATTLLILSINNDIDRLEALGGNYKSDQW